MRASLLMAPGKQTLLRNVFLLSPGHDDCVNIYSQGSFVTFIIIPRDAAIHIRNLDAHKSAGPGGMFGKALKLGGEIMIMYMTTLLFLSYNAGFQTTGVTRYFNQFISWARDWKQSMIIYVIFGRKEDKFWTLLLV